MFRSYLAILIVGFVILYTMSSIVGCCTKNNKYPKYKLKYYNVKGTNICYITRLNNYGNLPNILPYSDIPKTARVDTVIDSD